MPSPTDTFIQQAAQMLPQGMQGYGIALMIAGGFLLAALVVALLIYCEEAANERKRQHWDKKLQDSRPQEKRPASESWNGIYK